MKKIVFEVRRVVLHPTDATVLLRRAADPDELSELEVIEIRVPRAEDALVQQWISRVGKKIQLVPEDM